MQHYRDRNNLTFSGMETWRGALSSEKVKLLENSWAGIFRKHVMPNLPVHRLAADYSDHMGRPTKDLVTCMGALVLQQIFDLTDERTREQLAFDQQWHYALDTFDQKEQLLCLKTLWTVRQCMTRQSLDKEIFNSVTDKLAEAFQVDIRFQRLDSVHIHSNMARLGRVRLMARAITKFLKNLKRQDQDLYEAAIPDELSSRYLREQALSYFGDVKPSESKRRSVEIARDLYWLIQTFSDLDAVKKLYSFKLLERVFKEQCRISERSCGEDNEVVVIPAKEVSSDSLQNPSDPDASYDGHKGQGYQVQVMETFTPTEAEGDKDQPESEAEDSKPGAAKDEEPTLNLITHVEVEPAHVHDSIALKPALEDVEDRKLIPEELQADAAYGSDDNVKEAKTCSVELIAPVPGKKGDKHFEGFVFNGDTQVIETCPSGHPPERIQKNRRKGSLTAFWEESTCEGCSLRESGGCPVVKGKRGFRLQYLTKDVRIYQRRVLEEEDAFKNRYRYRAGIEGTNSRYLHMTGAKRLKYRGLERVRFAGTIKALGINLFRTAKYVQKIGLPRDSMADFGLKEAVNCTKSVLRTIKKAFKEILSEYPGLAQFAVAKL